MTNNLPDYTELEPPTDTPPTEYSTHERRAELLRIMERKGGPYAVNLSQLSDQYDVHRSTLSRDRDRLKESIQDQLGEGARLEKWMLYQHVVQELLEADDWRATKAAWEVRADYDDWLGEIGEQYREPDRVEADVEVDARRTEISYTVVREEGELPTDDEGGVDYEDIGFTRAPGGDVGVEAVEEVDEE
jgi:hypothetical protein